MPAVQRLRAAAPAAGADLSAAAPAAPHLMLVPPVPAIDELSPKARRQAFGARLKAVRERSGISLQTIAESTKVSASLLAALERGDASRWPKGIFRRAFFRDYATAIGLPADTYIAEFLQLCPDGEDHSAAVAAAPASPVSPLRLTLAPAAWELAPAHRRPLVLEFALVLPLAMLLTWWIDGNAWAGAGAVALCYARTTTKGAARAARGWWRSRGAT